MFVCSMPLISLLRVVPILLAIHSMIVDRFTTGTTYAQNSMLAYKSELVIRGDVILLQQQPPIPIPRRCDIKSNLCREPTGEPLVLSALAKHPPVYSIVQHMVRQVLAAYAKLQ